MEGITIREKIGRIIKAVLPLGLLYGAYWCIGFIPINYIYYPNPNVYREAITIFGIIAFILTFLVIAVGVFNICNIKQLGLIFLAYQPIKLLVDLTGLIYEGKYLNNYIYYSINFLTIFIFLGTAVVILKNKETGMALHTNIGKFLIRYIPVSLISILIPVLENILVSPLLNQTLPYDYGAEEFFNFIILIMSISNAVLTVTLAIFVKAVDATFNSDSKLISVETLKQLIYPILFSIAITIIWRLINLK